MLLRPLAYKDPSAIVIVYARNEAFKGLFLNVSLGDVEQVKKEAHSFSDFIIYDEASKSLTGEGDPQAIDLAHAGNNFFDFLGTSPQLGRFFVDEEHRPGNENVAIISDGLWRAKFGTAPDILQEKLRLDGEFYSILGVARSSLSFPTKVD